MTASRPRRRQGPRSAGLVSLCLLWGATADGPRADAQELRPDREPPLSRLPENPKTVAPDALCPALARALCSSMTECTCVSERVACAMRVLSACSAPNGPMGIRARTAREDGLLTYDGARASALVRRLARSAGCEAALDAFGWTHRSMLRFGGVLNGTVPDGAPCRIPFRPLGVNTCKSGICRAQTDGTPRCVPIAHPGDRCGPRVACIDEDALVTDEHLSRHGFGGFCGKDARCHEPGANGEPCQRPRECASGRCVDEICRPALETSAPCNASEDCASGLCADLAGSEEALCLPRKRGIEETCQRDEQCASHACTRGRCSEPMCPS